MGLHQTRLSLSDANKSFFLQHSILATFPFVFIFIFALFCFGLPRLATAASGEASFTMEVPPGKWKALKLRNLPRATTVGVATTATNPVFIIFLDKQNYARYPRISRPLFQGQLKKKLGFSVTIPDSGNYFVVFDNRQGDRESSIAMTVKASHDRSEEKEKLLQSLDKVEENLQSFQARLTRALIFDPISIEVQPCETAQSFRHDSTKGLTLCVEYAGTLQKALRDKRRSTDALLFSLFHEMGQELLHQWKEPFPRGVETSDEMATVLMVLFHLNDRVASTATFFSTNPKFVDAFAKVFPDNPHPLSVARARQILEWVQDPNLLPKWQPILLPHMQTALLRQLQQRPEVWTDAKLVEKELHSRKETTIDSQSGSTPLNGNNRLLF